MNTFASTDPEGRRKPLIRISNPTLPITMSRYAEISLRQESADVISAALDQVEAEIASYPTNDANIVRHLPKMGRRSETFAGEALALARINDHLMPKGLDLDRMEQAIRNRSAIREQYARVRKLADQLKLAMMLSGVDAFSDGLQIYGALKLSKEAPAVNAVQMLSKYFEHKKKPAKREEQSAPVAKVNGADSGVTTAPAAVAPPDGKTSDRSEAASPSPQTAPKVSTAMRDAERPSNSPVVPPPDGPDESGRGASDQPTRVAPRSRSCAPIRLRDAIRCT